VLAKLFSGCAVRQDKGITPRVIPVTNDALAELIGTAPEQAASELPKRTGAMLLVISIK